MALTKIEICNQALLRVGADTIASLDTGSDLNTPVVREAALCNIFFDQALAETLRIFPWNCCSARSIPSRLTESPAFGYAYAYQLPNDCARVVSIFDSPNQSVTGTRWIIEGRQILCDYKKVYLKYVRVPENVNTLDALTTQGLICKLALKLAMPLQLDDKLVTKITQELELIVLPSARSIDTFENKELLTGESSWMLSRDNNSPTNGFTW
jgi:hypothetical protein